MAQTGLVVTSILRSGTPISFTPSDPANGNSFPNDGHTWLILNNLQGAVPCTVTILVPYTVEGLAVANRIIPLQAGEVKVSGPFDQGMYNQPDGRVLFGTDNIIGICLASTT